MVQHSNIVKNNAYTMNQISTTVFGFANSEQEAYMFAINRPYTQAYIISLQEDIFWYKKIDINGQIVIFDTFDFQKRIPPEPEKPVTHNDLNDMENRIVDKLVAMLTSSQQKGDEICG